MSKYISNIITIVIVFSVFLSACAMDTYQSHYTRTGKVIEVDITNHIVTIEDTTQNIWIYETSEVTLNDTVKMYMFTSHTDNDICDDVITKIKRI